MQANYQYGAATTLDVQDSQTALVVANNSLNQATYDYEMAKARLRLAEGSPSWARRRTRMRNKRNILAGLLLLVSSANYRCGGSVEPGETSAAVTGTVVLDVKAAPVQAGNGQ